MLVVSHYSGKHDSIIPSLRNTASFGNDVHFIGDGNPILSDNIPGKFTYHDVSEYSQGLEELKKVFVHTGPHPEKFRWWGTARWFIFRNFMKKHGGPIFVIDGDVMIFDDISKYHNFYKDCDYTYSAHNPVCCIGQSFWNNQAAIDALCEDMLTWYIDPEFDPEKHTSDMTHVTRLLRYYNFNSANTYLHNHPGYIDHNMAMSNTFEMHHKFVMKKIEFENGQPYAFKDGVKNRFITLHCSGKAKREIYNYQNISLEQRAK